MMHESLLECTVVLQCGATMWCFFKSTTKVEIWCVTITHKSFLILSLQHIVQLIYNTLQILDKTTCTGKLGVICAKNCSYWAVLKRHA